jgi:transposase
LFLTLLILDFRGVRLVFLPAYSPDLNPIEEGFSAFKAWVRRQGREVQVELESGDSDRVAEILKRGVEESMTPHNIAGWYRHAGYG